VIVGTCSALLAGVVWTRAWRRRIGGCNGDVLGAAVEIREAAVLLALAGPLAG
jgi:cobalamin synthase